MMPLSLEILDLGDDYRNNNNFTGGLPAEWVSLTNLRGLMIVNCGLDGASRSLPKHAATKANCEANRVHRRTAQGARQSDEPEVALAGR